MAIVKIKPCIESNPLLISLHWNFFESELSKNPYTFTIPPFSFSRPIFNFNLRGLSKLMKGGEFGDEGEIEFEELLIFKLVLLLFIFNISF